MSFEGKSAGVTDTEERRRSSPVEARSIWRPDLGDEVRGMVGPSVPWARVNGDAGMVEDSLGMALEIGVSRG